MQNPIGEADLEWILHRNCEGTEQLQQEILCGEKLSVNIFYIRVREYKSRHNLSEVQNPREMLLSHADGEKLKNSSVFEHKKSTPSKMKECFVLLGDTTIMK